jgi:hypothetical protein
LASPAVPGNSAAAAGNVAIRSTNPVNPLSHDTSSSSTAVNNCRVPALYSPGTAAAHKGLQFH